MQVVIHSGMHKNGNSSFTLSLRPLIDDLKQAGVWVIPRTVKTNPGQLKTFEPDWITEQLNMAQSQSARLFLIAHEALSLNSVSELARLRQLLGPDPVTYVTVLRHWTTFLPSRWAQNCRTFDTQSIFAYIKAVISDPSRKDHSLHHTLTRAREAGMERQVVVSFENALAQDGIVAAIWRACGLPTAFLSDTGKSEWWAKKDPEEWSDIMRLFNGLRPVSEAMSANPLSDRHRGMSFDPAQHKPAILVPRLIEQDPDLIEDITGILAASKDTLHLTPDEFQVVAQDVENAVAPFLCNPIKGRIWPDPVETRTKASKLELTDLPADVINRMRRTRDAILSAET